MPARPNRPCFWEIALTDESNIPRRVARAYCDAPFARRLMQRYRDRICPIGILMDQVPAGSTVLDVGCGAGLFVLCLAAAGKAEAAVGIDSNAAAVAIARRALQRLPALGIDTPDRYAFLHLAADAPWPDGEFDVVSLIDVMHHVEPAGQQRFLAAAAAKVAPGGILLYKDVCRRPRWRAWANSLHDLIVARQWSHYVPVEDVEAWAGQEGLETLDRQCYSRLVYGHEMLVMRKAASAGHPGLGAGRPPRPEST